MVSRPGSWCHGLVRGAPSATLCPDCAFPCSRAPGRGLRTLAQTPPQPGGGLPERVCPVEPFSIVPRRLAGGLVPRLPSCDVTEKRSLRLPHRTDCAFPCSRAPGRGLRTLAQTPRQPGGGLLGRICPVEPFSIVPRSLAGGFWSRAVTRTPEARNRVAATDKPSYIRKVTVK